MTIQEREGGLAETVVCAGILRRGSFSSDNESERPASFDLTSIDARARRRPGIVHSSLCRARLLLRAFVLPLRHLSRVQRARERYFAAKVDPPSSLGRFLGVKVASVSCLPLFLRHELC